MEDNELYHYGILGMRWGIRRTPEELGHEILRNEHHQAETASKIEKMQRKHEQNPNRPFRKSEARLFKRAEKLRTEHADLLTEKDIAEKRQKALEAKAQYKKEKKEAKEAKKAQKKAIHDAKVAEKEAKEREKLNSHNLQNKPLSDMTDRELVDYLNRKANELKYQQYNPKPRTFTDDLKDFAKKNAAKTFQALADVGIDVGKEALKKELKKSMDEREIKNSREYLKGGKKIEDLSDDQAEKLKKRYANELVIRNNMKNETDSSNKNSSNSSSSAASPAVSQLISEVSHYGENFVSQTASSGEGYVNDRSGMTVDEFFRYYNSATRSVL